MISLVTGTYNRIRFLKKMVESFRNSICVGIFYEIIIVDGGSTDGTIDWCKSQKDIVLIEQGELLGAVRAFNVGFEKASGEYIIIGNDDIEFIDKSVLNAVSYMQDNPDVGIGCFHQDRDGKDFHIGIMLGIKDGKRVSLPYGQVCIVPKWLGDLVGWWGDYLYIYGGDNELSCHIHELGYKVEPIPCSCIHDLKVGDNLREYNNKKVKFGEIGVRNNTDFEDWEKRWKHSDGTFGAIVGSKTKPENRLNRKYRVLYMPIRDKSFAGVMNVKSGIRDAFNRVCYCTEFDYRNNTVDSFYETFDLFKPDIVLAQFHDTTNIEFIKAIRQAKKYYPDTKFINWNGDYWWNKLFDRKYINNVLSAFDIIGTVSLKADREYKRLGINSFRWSVGFEEINTKWVYGQDYIYDVVFLGNGYSRARKDLATKLKSLEPDYKVGIFGYGYPDGISSGQTEYDFDKNAELLLRSKITISDCQWKDSEGAISNRLVQSLSCGAFVMQEYCDWLVSLFGYKDEKHLVYWNNQNLLDKIKVYINREDSRKRISNAGYNFVHKEHNFDKKVEEFFENIK